MTYKIILVDDEPANLRLLERLFRRDYQVLSASSGLEAISLLEQHDVALLITDQRMPGMTGIELIKHAAVMRPHVVRILLTGYTDVSDLVEAINCGQVYKYVTKPWNNDDLRQTVSRAVDHYKTNRARHELAAVNERLVERQRQMTEGFVRAIADVLDAKDEYVHGSGRRVSGYAATISRRMHLDDEFTEQLKLAALLHDIGMIATPDQILLKPTKLTDEERHIMQLHAERGARILASVPGMEEVALAVRHHHEHFDGSGYPDGLHEEQIPLAARIIAVVDAYDALTNPRPFREARSHEEALQILHTESGTQFDPEIVKLFAEIDTIAEIRQSITTGHTNIRLSAPRAAEKINELSFADLMAEVDVEPMLAVAVLRKANKNPDVEATAQLKTACERLGEEQVRALVAEWHQVATAVEHGEQFAERALRCATAARLLAEHTGIVEADEAYSLGLLHDVGEVLLHSLFPTNRVVSEPFVDTAQLDFEVNRYGVDHAQVGQWMLEACGVPRRLTTVVQTHHDVQRINDPAALLLHVADCIAYQDGTRRTNQLNALGSSFLVKLNLNRADLARIHDCAAEAVEQRLALPY